MFNALMFGLTVVVIRWWVGSVAAEAAAKEQAKRDGYL